MNSKCVKTPSGVQIVGSESARQAQQVPSSTVAHNAIATSQCSRRKKITIQNCNQLDRKNRVRARLLKKLAEKKTKQKK